MPASAACSAHAVSGLAHFAEWVLRSPESIAQRTGSAAIVFDHQDPGHPPCQPPDVWRAASACGTLGARDCVLSQDSRQVDAQSADCAQGDSALPGNDGLAQYQGGLPQLGQAVL